MFSGLSMRQESFLYLWDEAQALTKMHWKETDVWKDGTHIPLSPDREQYEQLQGLGLIHAFTVRDEGLLVGYGVYLTTPNLHHSTTKIAACDIIYLHPSYRKTRAGAELIGYAERALELIGTQYIYMNVKTLHDFGSMLEKIGYTEIEKVYAKKLGE